MPDQDNHIDQPLDVRIGKTEDPQIDLFVDASIDLSPAPEADVPLEQPTDETAATRQAFSVASSARPAASRSTEPTPARRSPQPSERRVVPHLAPARVERSSVLSGELVDLQVEERPHRSVHIGITVAVALLIGAVAGFIGGVAVGSRDRSPRAEGSGPGGRPRTEQP